MFPGAARHVCSNKPSGESGRSHSVWDSVCSRCQAPGERGSQFLSRGSLLPLGWGCLIPEPLNLEAFSPPSPACVQNVCAP